MSNEEIMSFIQRIQKDYPKFKLSTAEYEVWQSVLSKTSKEIIEAKYNEHLNGEYKKNIPSVMYFDVNSNETKQERKFLRQCEFCGKYLYHDAMVEHEGRHKSIRNISMKMKKIFSKEINEEKLLEMSDKEFNEKYDEFLEKIIDYTTGAEKRRLMIINYLKNNPGKTIPVDLEQIIEIGKIN